MRQYLLSDTILQHPLFDGMPEEQVAALFHTSATRSEYARGSVLFSPSHYVRALAFLDTGNALVYKVSQGTHRVLMSRLGPGDAFGMASMFYEGEAYPTEIVAEKECTVWLLPKEALEQAFIEMPLLARNYITLLSERIHFLNRRIEVLAGDDVPTRLLHLLRSLAGPDSHGTLPYSLSQMAELLGIGRASLYRALDALEEQGKLTREGRRFSLQTMPENDQKMEEIP